MAAAGTEAVELKAVSLDSEAVLGGDFLLQAFNLAVFEPATGVPSVAAGSLPDFTGSSFSGPPISNFKTFTEDGTQMQLHLTFGYFFRF